MATQAGTIAFSRHNFLFVQPCDADKNCVTRPCLVNCVDLSELVDGAPTRERVYCRDPKDPNKRIVLGTKKTFPGDGSGQLQILATAGVKSWIYNLRECPVRLIVVTIICERGDDFNKWVEVTIAENVYLGQITKSNLVNRDPNNDTEVQYSVDFTYDPNLSVMWEPRFNESAPGATGNIIDFTICEHGAGCPGDNCYEAECGSIFAVTDANELIHSIDGGDSYDPIPMPSDPAWPAAGANSVMCCGRGKDSVVKITAMGGGNNVITATTADAGQNWNVTTLPAFVPIDDASKRAFQFGSKIFYGGHGQGNISLSTDCGQTSQLVSDGTFSSAAVISIFRCGRKYYAMHEDGTLIVSSNGGFDWTLASFNNFPANVTTAYCPDGCDGKCIWVGLADGSLQYTQDEGDTWQKPPQWNVLGQPITAMAWCDRFTGAVAVGKTVWITVDGGYYWKCLGAAADDVTCMRYCGREKLFVSMKNGKMGLFCPDVETCELDECDTK